MGAELIRSPESGHPRADGGRPHHVALPPYRVSAYNTAKASENKIHDDATARRFGFSGGLVGGVHVYAYMTHHAGRSAGAVPGWSVAPGSCKFCKPVYEGDIAEIVADETIPTGMSLQVISAGVLCATGRRETAGQLAASPVLSDFQAVRPAAHRAGRRRTVAGGRPTGLG